MVGSAILNLHIAPRRMVCEQEAADYVGLPRRHFRVDCTVTPVELPRGRKLWDLRDLDEWLDGLKSGSADRDDDILSRLN